MRARFLFIEHKQIYISLRSMYFYYRKKAFASFLAAAVVAVSAAFASAADVSIKSGSLSEGKIFSIDFNFKIPAKEHIYSNRPSENGSPTTISLKLPEGYKLESLEWPKPSEFEFFGMKSEGYSGDITVRARISPPAKFQSGATAKASATVDMLACSDMCVPIKKELSFELPAALVSSQPVKDSGTNFVDAKPGGGEPATPQNGKIQNAQVSSISYAALFTAIFGAFLGGIILNLMPCVFPVIGIKILSFASADDSRSRIMGAAAYSLGIVASFIALAAVLVGLRAAGSGLGWGFQLQNPAFSSSMALLFFAMGLSFAGMFEIGAGFAGGRLGGTGKNKYLASALSGVLAVLVASPCTAPFMGTAIGAALATDAGAGFTFSVFAALGIGMAFPYILLSLIPSLSKKMPRPGAWMETLKHILSIPMFASAIWLAWVYCEQTGAAARIMSAALVLAVGLRIFGLYYMPHFGRAARTSAAVVCLASIAAAAWIAWDAPAAAASDSAQNWSEQKLSELRKSGKIVYVDFTASWCLTCQYNKKILESSAVQEAFKKRGVKFIVGDWTNKNPDISKKLAEFGRAGVPLNLVYPADENLPPEVLPAILTPDIVIEAVDKAAEGCNTSKL